MSNDALTHTVTVLNPEGLHARPADMLVRAAGQFQSNILIGKNAEMVDCKSILSLLTLGAAQGTVLQISADGPDAKEAIGCLKTIFESGFDDVSEAEGVGPAAEPS